MCISRTMCRWPVLPALLLWLTAPGAAAASGLPDTIERIKPAVVGVGTVQRTRQPPARILGTGFVVGGGRHVLTNAHVLPELVDEANMEFLAVFAGHGHNPQIRQARRLAVDEDHDVALLEIGGAPLPALRLGDSRAVREGEEYLFTGFPIGLILGLYPATHRGMISARTPIVTPAAHGRELDEVRIQRLRNPYEVFQLDATAYPGNSGSPLYHPRSGEVVGIINRVFVKESKESALTSPSGISYAIPIEHARRLMKKAGVE